MAKLRARSVSDRRATRYNCHNFPIAAHLAGTVLDHDERALSDGAGLLRVCERGASVGRLEVHIVLLVVTLRIRIALGLRGHGRATHSNGTGEGGWRRTMVKVCADKPVLQRGAGKRREAERKPGGWLMRRAGFTPLLPLFPVQLTGPRQLQISVDLVAIRPSQSVDPRSSHPRSNARHG